MPIIVNASVWPTSAINSLQQDLKLIQRHLSQVPRSLQDDLAIDELDRFAWLTGSFPPSEITTSSKSLLMSSLLPPPST